jgi:hypothetical protein
MMTHFVQYAQYLKLANVSQKETMDDDWRGRVVEIVGFCIGFLSGVVVSAAKSDLKTFGSVALRLAMLLGAVGDVQEAEEQYTSLAVGWKNSGLERELDGLLEKYPGVCTPFLLLRERSLNRKSYIIVRYDENRATISTPRRSMPRLQQTLQSAGFSATPVDFNGRYHWPPAP